MAAESQGSQWLMHGRSSHVLPSPGSQDHGELFPEHAMQSISMRRLGRADRWAPESHSSAPQEDSGGGGGAENALHPHLI